MTQASDATPQEHYKLTRDLWSEAFSALGPEEQEKLKPNTDLTTTGSTNAASLALAAVQAQKVKCLDKRWSFLFRGKTLFVRDYLDKITGWIQKFEDIADQIVAFDVSGHAAMPWACVKLFVDIAAKDFKKFGSMLVGMEYVAREIHFYTIFEVAYLTKISDAREDLANSLLKTYSKLLSFLAEAREYYDEHTVKRAFKAIFNEGGVDEMISAVDSERAHIEQNAHLIDKQDLDENVESLSKGQQDLIKRIDQWKAPLEGISSSLGEVLDSTRLAKQKEILNWISPIAFANHHDRARSGRLAGTGEWLLNSPAFTGWSSHLKDSVCWVHGIPGSGKTKLASLVIDQVSESLDPSVEAITYFYCIRDTAEPDRAEPAQILRCIARQLAYHKPTSSVRSEAIAAYDTLTMGGLQTHDIDMDLSIQLIIDLASDLANVTIAIDALDECNDAPTLLNKLGSLREKNDRIRLFFTSRDIKAVTAWMQNVPHADIRIDLNEGDINRFVEFEVDKRIQEGLLLEGKVSTETKAKIIELLTNGAQGMFRWASLQIERITPRDMPLKDEAEVLHILGEPLTSLSAVYDKIYEQIMRLGPDSKKFIDRALRFLTCSYRTMSTESFLTAISLASEPGISTEMLLALSCNLIVLDEEANIFRFAHQSVREYLEARDDYKKAESNNVAAEICFTYLTRPMPPKSVSGHKETGKDKDSSLDLQPTLHDYATLFWPLHFENSRESTNFSALAGFITTFLLRRRANPAFSAWMRDVQILSRAIQWQGESTTRYLWELRTALESCFCDPPNPWFLACIFGIPDVIDKGPPPPVLKQNNEGRGPLHLACKYGKLTVVERLLSQKEAIEMEDVHGHTPLYYAIPHPEIVKALFDHEKNIQITEDIFRKAIQEFGLSEGEEGVKMLQLLVEKGGVSLITVNMVHVAAGAKNGKLIEYLLDQRCDLEITQDLLTQAALWSSSAVMRYLFEQEPSLKVTENILFAAAGNLAHEPMEVLLEYFQEPNIPVSVLVRAVSNSDVKMLEMIFRKDPSVAISQEVLETATANRNCAAQVVTYLLDREPKLQITSDLLKCTTRNSDEQGAAETTKILLARNPHVEITEKVLEEAIIYGQREMMLLLLTHSTSLTITDHLVEIAAAHWIGRGHSTLDLVLQRNSTAQIPKEALLKSASHLGKSDFELLLNRCGQMEVTQDLLAHASSNNDPSIMDVLLRKEPSIIPGNACFKYPIVNGYISSPQMLDLLQDRRKDFVPDEEIMSWAIVGNNKASAYFLNKQKSLAPTEETWKNAVVVNKDEGPSRCVVLKVLLGRGYRPQNIDPLVERAAKQGQLNAVDSLLEYTTTPGIRERWRPVAQLMNACFEEDLALVEKLLSDGVNPDERSDVDGRTPLLVAVAMRRYSIAKLLLDTHAVDIEACDPSDGVTPLLGAAMNGTEDIIRLLVEHGANVAAKTCEGETALDIVKRDESLGSLVKFLQEAGCSAKTESVVPIVV